MSVALVVVSSFQKCMCSVIQGTFHEVIFNTIYYIEIRTKKNVKIANLKCFALDMAGVIINLIETI